MAGRLSQFGSLEYVSLRLCCHPICQLEVIHMVMMAYGNLDERDSLVEQVGTCQTECVQSSTAPCRWGSCRTLSDHSSIYVVLSRAACRVQAMHVHKHEKQTHAQCTYMSD